MPMNEDELKEWLKARTTPKKIENFGNQGVVCSRTKLKPGSLDGVREWFKTLKERQDELIAFTEEGVSLESVFIEKSGDDYFLIFYIRSDDFKKTYEAIQKAMLPITVYHFNCWETYCEAGSEVLELMFDLKRL
jgi:hypothetical protein